MLYSQAPFINSVSKISASTQETISLQGINFGTNASAVKVVFGSVSASPQTISDQLIEVTVPAGASYEGIQVTNTATGLSGYAREPFLLSYGGENPFNINSTSAQSDFDSEDGLYDLAAADFDGDGKVDMATANDNATNISVFRNTSTAGTISFSKTQLSVGAKTLHVAAGDLNGDGKPEIIVSQVNADKIFIFRNASTPGAISFASSSLTIAGSKASSIRVADLDMNGKPELVVTDQSTSRLFVLNNQSTLAAISFATPFSITVPGTSGTDGIAIGDLDGDEFPEMVVSEFLNANGKMFVLKNESSPGNMSFTKITSINVPSTLSNVRLGDLDGDSKADIAGTLLLSSSILVMGNQSTSSEINFSDAVFFESNEKPWGIDFGDVDGDGKTDVVVASITQKSFTVMNNQSTAGSFSFLKNTKTTTFINRYVKITDLDNDGRPDFAFTSINDNNLGIMASKISAVRNLNCVVPKITPEGPLTICDSFTQRLDASFNEGATYGWLRNGGAVTGSGSGSFIEVTQSGTYTVTLTSDGGACVKTSTAGVQVNVVTGAPAGTATPAPVSPVCIGGTLNLSVNDVGATAYTWTGPGGFSANGLAVSRTNFLAEHAGVYELEVMVGTCIAQRETVVVDVVNVPGAEVRFSGSDLICEGQTKSLSVFPVSSGYTYQWEEETSGPVSGATNATFTASSTGRYLVKLTSTASPTCSAVETPSKKIRIATVPVVDFTYPATACLGQQVDFTNATVTDNDPDDPEINYVWEFGDGQASTTEDANHIYNSAQNFNVKLTVSYRDNACPGSKQQSITIQQAPLVAITTPLDNFGICPNENLLLQVEGSFNSYNWSTGETTSSISVTESGTYSVEVTTTGCTLSASRNVERFSEPVVRIAATPPSVNLSGTTELTVTGLEGTELVEFHWTPSKSLSDSLSANPTAIPSGTTTYKVTGKDANGCPYEAELEVAVIPENILNLLRPSHFITPNGDLNNDLWKVEYIEIFDQCGVTIYDERGLKVFEATPYLNDWTGISSKGQTLPAGVYYYIIRCGEPGETPLSGSINIVR